MKKIKIIIFLCFLIFSKFLYAEESARVDKNQNKDITAHGICKNVTNGFGTDIFIPLKTLDEWQAFLSNRPKSILINNCAPTYEWEIGAFSACPASCNATQTRTVQCRNKTDNTIVADANCTGGKPPVSQPCNVSVPCANQANFCSGVAYSAPDTQPAACPSCVGTAAVPAWGGWGSYGMCDAACKKYRTRTCIDPNGKSCSGGCSAGAIETESASCAPGEGLCPAAGGIGGECDDTLGGPPCY